MRSIAGPISGAMTANGAIDKAGRAAPCRAVHRGRIEKNNELAREIAMTASPATMRAWGRARRWNGVKVERSAGRP